MDIVDRGYQNTIIQDFKQYDKPIDCDVVMNPPYKEALEHVSRAVELLWKDPQKNNGKKVCVFLKIQFLEGKARRVFFNKYKPRTIYVYSDRRKCYKNGIFTEDDRSAMMFCWFVWEVGVNKDPVIKFIGGEKWGIH